VVPGSAGAPGSTSWRRASCRRSAESSSRTVKWSPSRITNGVLHAASGPRSIMETEYFPAGSAANSNCPPESVMATISPRNSTSRRVTRAPATGFPAASRRTPCHAVGARWPSATPTLAASQKQASDRDKRRAIRGFTTVLRRPSWRCARGNAIEFSRMPAYAGARQGCAIMSGASRRIETRSTMAWARAGLIHES